MPDYENPADYEYLNEIISFKGFRYEHYYRDEKEVLTKRLEEKGFTDIVFSMGEVDSFSPLTRICQAKDSDGKFRKFFYG